MPKFVGEAAFYGLAEGGIPLGRLTGSYCNTHELHYTGYNTRERLKGDSPGKESAELLGTGMEEN